MIIGFITGLVVGGIVAIFIYRNNKRVIGGLADKVDSLVEQLKDK